MLTNEKGGPGLGHATSAKRRGKEEKESDPTVKQSQQELQQLLR